MELGVCRHGWLDVLGEGENSGVLCGGGDRGRRAHGVGWLAEPWQAHVRDSVSVVEKVIRRCRTRFFSTTVEVSP